MSVQSKYVVIAFTNNCADSFGELPAMLPAKTHSGIATIILYAEFVMSAVPPHSSLNGRIVISNCLYNFAPIVYKSFKISLNS